MRIQLFPTELQSYPITVPPGLTVSPSVTLRSDFATGYAVIQNYNGQAAVRRDKEQMKAVLPARNVFWQFVWLQNNSVIWTVRQEFFSQAITIPYETSKVIEALNRFFLNRDQPQYNLGVRAVAPTGTQFQFTNLGGLWTA